MVKGKKKTNLGAGPCIYIPRTLRLSSFSLRAKEHRHALAEIPRTLRPWSFNLIAKEHRHALAEIPRTLRSWSFSFAASRFSRAKELTPSQNGLLSNEK